ncbi:MAG: LysR substrate-binding domain-containing protein, partial [Rubrivivax sp.]|jgi:DNA-binding transcriptional LysR family regulator
METRWLEDFVSLAETRSFSRSAQLRHVTQPAFSRRIQALEAWAGTDLVDRSAFPTRLTPAGEALHGQALEILASLQTARNTLRSLQAAGQDVIEFAVPHTLAFTFFPQWLMTLKPRFGGLKTRLIALNVHDAMLRLTEGGCDLLIAYHHASHPLPLSPERYQMLSLGQETLIACARPDERGAPLFRLPAVTGRPVPMLAYSEGAYMARMVELILRHGAGAQSLERVHETAMAEGLKAMALQGHGLAFLPRSTVEGELAAGRLMRAAPEGQFELTMEVRLYRERPELSRHAKPLALRLWQHLSDAHATRPHPPHPPP